LKTLQVHYLPQFVAEADLAGETVIVVDLLRASTTICHALAAGAADVTAFLEVGELVRAAQAAPHRDELVLGGERQGRRIDGFDLGNSPAEYTADEVFGRRVFFTTTNGTMALQHTRLAARVLVGALVNLTATVDAAAADDAVHVLCAGTNGHVTREDQLAAGAIAHELLRRDQRDCSDLARAVLGEWQELLNTAAALGRQVKQVIAVDNSTAMLSAARARLKRMNNVDVRRGELTELPIDEATCDAAVVLLVLTYVDDLKDALGEIARVLKPNGIAVIVDLLRHDRDDFRRKMEQRHLGFATEEVENALRNAGFGDARCETLPPESGTKGPALLLARATK